MMTWMIWTSPRGARPSAAPRPCAPSPSGSFPESSSGPGSARRAFCRATGLAEATLFVSGRSQHGRSPPMVLRTTRGDLERGVVQPIGVSAEAGGTIELVSSGPPSYGQRVVIVEPESGQRCESGQVGEVWVSGPNVAEQYANDPAATDELLNAQLSGDQARYLATGDLGAMWNGELFVVGRLKNLIIVRGRKIHAEDIEQVVSRGHELFQQNRCAVFAVQAVDQDAGEETVVIIQEAARRPRTEDEVRQALDGARNLVAAQMDVVPREIMLVRPGTIPITTSGKIRHADVRTAYLQGGIKSFSADEGRLA